jgi:hypothetical protein
VWCAAQRAITGCRLGGTGLRYRGGFGGASLGRSSSSFDGRWVSPVYSGLHCLDILQSLVDPLTGAGEVIDVDRIGDVEQGVLEAGI